MFWCWILGLDDVECGSWEIVGVVVCGFVVGVWYVYECKLVFYGLVVIVVYWLCYGVVIVCILLLYCNYFYDDGFFCVGLVGFV